MTEAVLSLLDTTVTPELFLKPSPSARSAVTFAPGGVRSSWLGPLTRTTPINLIVTTDNEPLRNLQVSTVKILIKGLN